MPESLDPYAELARVDLGPTAPAPLQQAVAAALAWLVALDREATSAAHAPTSPRAPTPPR